MNTHAPMLALLMGCTCAAPARADSAAWQRVAELHEQGHKEGKLPDELENYADAATTLGAALLAEGKRGEALAFAKMLLAHPQHPACNTLSLDAEGLPRKNGTGSAKIGRDLWTRAAGDEEILTSASIWRIAETDLPAEIAAAACRKLEAARRLGKIELVEGLQTEAETALKELAALHEKIRRHAAARAKNLGRTAEASAQEQAKLAASHSAERTQLMERLAAARTASGTAIPTPDPPAWTLKPWSWGKPAAFSLTGRNGESISLEKLAGAPVLINFYLDRD